MGFCAYTEFIPFYCWGVVTVKQITGGPQLQITDGSVVWFPTWQLCEGDMHLVETGLGFLSSGRRRPGSLQSASVTTLGVAGPWRPVTHWTTKVHCSHSVPTQPSYFSLSFQRSVTGDTHALDGQVGFVLDSFARLLAVVSVLSRFKAGWSKTMMFWRSVY